ncbi:MAG: ligase-associated DNA damage response exonuclease [Hyphomicrobiales bacterium]|nr:ligase-associated DNA damage response exonuclease [Hyphomicrobiales bacterium]
MDLICATPRGLYCPPGDFYIDPWRPVDFAVITHGHSDHARPGSARYLCTQQSLPILEKRLGSISAQTLNYGETVERNGVRVSLHPAGHVLGSAQARVEYRGEVWVASGDYKLEDDGVSAPFEPVRCDVFITESTFALPIYRWRAQQALADEINQWRRENSAQGRASVVYAYALGKAQRILRHLDASDGPIVCHGAIEPLNAIHRALGASLPATIALDELDKRHATRAIFIAPPSALGSRALTRLGAYSDAFASGWMQVRGDRRRRGVDRGFVMSDHVDWPGALAAIAATGAQRVLVTHGFTHTLARYLREQGLEADEIAGYEARDNDLETDET